MRINRKRLEESMERLGWIGETPAGVLTRLALSGEDLRGRDLPVGWMVTVERMGDVFASSACCAQSRPAS